MAVKTKNSKKPRKPKNCGHTKEQHKKIRADRNLKNLERALKNEGLRNLNQMTPWEAVQANRAERRKNDPNVQARKKNHIRQTKHKVTIASNNAA